MLVLQVSLPPQGGWRSPPSRQGPVYGAIKKKKFAYKEKRRAIRDSLSTALDAPLATLESDGAGYD